MRPLLLLGLMLLSSCFLFKKDKEEVKTETTRPRLVGRVASIPAGADFVLVEAYGSWRVPEGGLLSAVGTEGRTASLVATGERLGQHAAADIRSGEAKVGDPVYYRPVAAEVEPPASVETPVPAVNSPELETQKASGEPPAKP